MCRDLKSITFLTDPHFVNRDRLEKAINKAEQFCKENNWIKEGVEPCNTRELCKGVSTIFSDTFYVPCITGFRLKDGDLTFMVMSRQNFSAFSFPICEVNS